MIVSSIYPGHYINGSRPALRLSIDADYSSYRFFVRNLVDHGIIVVRGVSGQHSPCHKVGMEETILEKLARLAGKATSKVLDALGKRGFDIRGKLSAPISRVPRRNPFTEAKNERVMADPETIYNWRRLDNRITTSGQPTEPQLADIHDLGVRHIVNLGLHTHEKALPDEATSVIRLGMTYIHIPVDFQNPTDQDFDQFCSAMGQLKDVPVHVHCIANYRVSAFFYRYRRDVLGMDEAEARADMEDVWHPKGVWATFVGR